MTTAEVEAMMATVDTDGDGISLDELCVMIGPRLNDMEEVKDSDKATPKLELGIEAMEPSYGEIDVEVDEWELEEAEAEAAAAAAKQAGADLIKREQISDAAKFDAEVRWRKVRSRATNLMQTLIRCKDKSGFRMAKLVEDLRKKAIEEAVEAAAEKAVEKVAEAEAAEAGVPWPAPVPALVAAAEEEEAAPTPVAVPEPEPETDGWGQPPGPVPEYIRVVLYTEEEGSALDGLAKAGAAIVMEEEADEEEERRRMEEAAAQERAKAAAQELANDAAQKLAQDQAVEATAAIERAEVEEAARQVAAAEALRAAEAEATEAAAVATAAAAEALQAAEVEAAEAEVTRQKGRDGGEGPRLARALPCRATLKGSSARVAIAGLKPVRLNP